MTNSKKIYPKVTIVIPVKRFNDNLKECILHCLELDYNDYEIIILPDEEFKNEFTEKVRIIETGPMGPSEKRDIALDKARGEILAFLDDDAFPAKGWLKHAVAYFENPDVAAVGGPAVTPSTDDLRQKASGLVFSSILGSGKLSYRYVPKKSREVEDYPSCNLIVKKDVLKKIGGFKTTYWPGEDTVLCLEITRNLNKKIIYSPNVLVYHHRRRVFLPHLKQVTSYALHRGYFVKKYPQTSRRLVYFLPSLFVLGIMAGIILSFFNPILKNVFLIGIISYLTIMFLDSALRSRQLKLTFFVYISSLLTHICYGIWFVKGMLKKRLKEE